MADVSKPDRKDLADKGKALPDKGGGGRFPIRHRGDLERAIKAVGRVKPPTDEARAKVRRHIMSRAKALGLSSLIPSDWAPDGSLKGGAGGKPGAPAAGPPKPAPPFTKKS